MRKKISVSRVSKFDMIYPEYIIYINFLACTQAIYFFVTNNNIIVIISHFLKVKFIIVSLAEIKMYLGKLIDIL